MMTKAFTVASQVRQELGTSVEHDHRGGGGGRRVPRRRWAICDQRRVLILGAGQMALATVREFQNGGRRCRSRL